MSFHCEREIETASNFKECKEDCVAFSSLHYEVGWLVDGNIGVWTRAKQSDRNTLCLL